MPGESLSLSERVQIEVDVAAGELNEVIAAGLGRAPSTVGREFARNRGRAGYQAVAAHARAQRCRARPKAFALSQPGLAHHVETRRQVGHLEGDLILGSFNRSVSTPAEN